MGVRWRVGPVALLLALGAACGCTAPVSFPRTGEVATPGQFRVRAGSFIGIAPKRGRVRGSSAAGADPDAPPRYVETTDFGVGESVFGSHDLSAGDWFRSLLGTAWAMELAASLGVFPGCEIGTLAGYVRAGAELRCGLPPGSPIGVAISGGLAAHPGLLGLLTEDGFEVGEYRGGIDLSVPHGGHAWLLNLYLGRTRTPRHLHLQVSDHGEWFGDTQRIERDEWRLSVPLGIALGAAEQRGRLVIALVPEYTLHSREVEAANDEVTDFEQRWAFYLVIAASARLGPFGSDRQASPAR